MPRPITVDEVASFPYRGLRQASSRQTVSFQRMAYELRTLIGLGSISPSWKHQIHTDLSKEGAQSGRPSSLTFLLS